jgi:hypothetical protein
LLNRTIQNVRRESMSVRARGSEENPASAQCWTFSMNVVQINLFFENYLIHIMPQNS